MTTALHDSEDRNLAPEGISKEKAKKKKSKKKKKAASTSKKQLDTFDARGIQTLFRTVSRNHYNLLKMVDNKASIILTVNSIIISLMLGGLLAAPESEKVVFQSGGHILIPFSIGSMIFALLSMLPHKYVGRIFRNSAYKGTLHAANYAGMQLDDFRLEFQRIMKTGKNTYDEIITDLYFLGKAIRIKQRLVVTSTTLFLVGLSIFMGHVLIHRYAI